MRGSPPSRHKRGTVPISPTSGTVPDTRGTVPHSPRGTVPYPPTRGTVPHTPTPGTVPYPPTRGTFPHPPPPATVPHPPTPGTVPHPPTRATVPHPPPTPRKRGPGGDPSRPASLQAPRSTRARRAALAAMAALAFGQGAAFAREAIDASPPQSLAVTLYRDPNRGPDQQMERDWPRGFAMITETRQVTLPPGESTIRFAGVAEGMVAVSAIVTGLPGGTIEKNRNADLLSPAARVDGTLGSRVTVPRTIPATGEAGSQAAVVRTRADGGLVLQTGEGFEAVRCSGLPE